MDLGVTFDQKMAKLAVTRVGREGRMFHLCYSPEGHKLLLNPAPLLPIKTFTTLVPTFAKKG